MTDNILIVTATPARDGQQEMGQYLSSVMPLIMAAGGQLMTRCKISETISGDAGFAMVLVMRFENADAIRNLFASDAYKALIEVRDRGFSKIEILIGDDAI